MYFHIHMYLGLNDTLDIKNDKNRTVFYKNRTDKFP